MNYEKEYKETFERAQKIYNDIKNDVIIGFPEQITYIFPNINDSENERIRKGLIEIFDSALGQDFLQRKAGLDRYKVISYLKKLKEPKDAKLERVINASRRVLNNWLDGSDCPDVSGDFTELEYAFRDYDGEEKQKEQDPIKVEVYEVGKGTTICGQNYKCKKDYKEGNCWYIKDVIYHCSRDGYLNDQNGVSWSCTPEWFNEYIQSNTEWAEEEKTRFVSGQFLQCKLSFDEFKEGEHYWLEYVGDDMYVGRSDNILNQKFHITPRQLYTLFSQQLEEKQKEQNNEEGDFTIYHPQKNGSGKYECIPFSFYGSLTSFSNDKDLMDFLNECFYDKEECERWCEVENKPELPECKHKIKKDSVFDYLCESSGNEKQKEPHYTKRNALFDKCVENCDPKTVEEVNKRVDDIMNMPELSAFEQALTNFIGYWEDDEERWPSKFVKKHGKHILDMAREELQKEQKPTSFNEPYNPDDYEVVMEGNATSVKMKNQKEYVADSSKTSADNDDRIRKAALEGIEYLEHNLGWDAIGDTDILDVKEYIEKQKEQSEEPKIAFGDWGDKEKKESIITCLQYMRFVKKITNQEYDDLVRWFEDNLVSNVLEKDGWTIANEQTDTIKEDYYGAFLRGEMRGYLRGINKQKEQIPYTDFVIKPHKGDDNNPYDMRVSDAQEYAINRGFGIPFNDGEVYIDERHMTQTIGNILRWADEHPKEQKPNFDTHWENDTLVVDCSKQKPTEIPFMNGDADLYFDEWNQQHHNPTKRQCFEEGIRFATKVHMCCNYSDTGKEPEPIKEVFGFKIGDKVRLKDGDGRPHIIKSFEEIEGIHGPNFYRVTFEDNSASDHIFTGDHYKDGYYTNMEKLEEQKPIDYEHEMWKNCEANYNKGKEIGFKEGYDKAMNDLNPTWTYNDEQMYQNIIEVLAATLNYKQCKGTDTGLYVVGLNKEIEWLKNIINKLKKEQ